MRPSASYSVLAVLVLRPSVARCSPTTTCGSPSTGSSSTTHVIRASTLASPADWPAAQPLVQSRAAQVQGAAARAVGSRYSCQSAASGAAGVQVAASLVSPGRGSASTG